MRQRRVLALALLGLWWTPVAGAAILGETVEYVHGETALEGYLAYDDATPSPRPGIVVVHEWTGLGAYVKRRADQLASLGYVALAIDMYGKGIRAKDHQEAAKLAAVYQKDRALMRGRAMAGLSLLRRHELVDAERMAAIGYCFGGTTVLELARSGADLRGVVSFHGLLEAAPAPEARSVAIHAKVLVLNGAKDPLVPPEVLTAFQREMREAGADWQVVTYGEAAHGFTNPEAGHDPSHGAAYDPIADRRSWQAMALFLREVFEEGGR